MKIYPQKINAQNFEPYGSVYDLKNGTEGCRVYKAQTFTDRMIEMAPFGESMVHLGMTEGSAAPCVIQSMEIHPSAEEAILCTEDSVILCVALWDGKDYPSGANIRAYELQQGQAVVLKQNVWHDACHGIGRNTRYCWFAQACPQGLGWVSPDDAPSLETFSLELKE